MPFLTQDTLISLYSSGLSMQQIAKKYSVSIHKVVYWMEKYNIPRRSTSEAIYLWNNPDGDPFVFKPPETLEMARLFGLGVGLYWGEGNKLNKTSVRLCNTDPHLIKTFMMFLENLFCVDRNDLKFGLQIFTDIDPLEATNFWIKNLEVKEEQFYKTTITISHSIGTYRKKSRFGVIMLNYHNRKLRDLLVGFLPK